MKIIVVCVSLLLLTISCSDDVIIKDENRNITVDGVGFDPIQSVATNNGVGIEIKLTDEEHLLIFH